LNLRTIAEGAVVSSYRNQQDAGSTKISGISRDRELSMSAALEMALRLKPDVIFFLTDGQEPPIHAGELEQLKLLERQEVTNSLHRIRRWQRTFRSGLSE